jgi:Flp pilus assembly pilin Flp
MDITDLIWSFLTDERGTECAEFAIVSVVVTCGTVKGLQDVQGVLEQKLHCVAEEIR